ncbi:MAG: polymer-forming cytoskeletal protein [Acidobacteria bacterium]|nr:polymer-forming cytoskeletal protein [Acidobacteriota bacterium]
MWKREQPDQSIPAPAGPLERRSAEREKVIMDLGKSVVIKGELSASEDLTLYGQMEGSVRLHSHTLTIGPHAHIRAEVAARTVVVMGAVTGNVTADKVEIQAAGSVNGDIVSARLAIADGGFFRGKVDMAQARPNQMK